MLDIDTLLSLNTKFLFLCADKKPEFGNHVWPYFFVAIRLAQAVNLSPDEIDIDITQCNSAVIYLTVKGYNLYYEILFGDAPNVTLTVFKDKALLLSLSGTIEQIDAQATYILNLL